MNSKQTIEEAANTYITEIQSNALAGNRNTSWQYIDVSDAFKAGAYWQLEQFKAQEQKPQPQQPLTEQEIKEVKAGSLVKRFGEAVAEKQKYKELYEHECKSHYFTRLGWASTCDERDKLKGGLPKLDEPLITEEDLQAYLKSEQPLTDEEISNLFEKCWDTTINDEKTMSIQGFTRAIKAALKLK